MFVVLGFCGRDFFFIHYCWLGLATGSLGAFLATRRHRFFGVLVIFLRCMCGRPVQCLGNSDGGHASRIGSKIFFLGLGSGDFLRRERISQSAAACRSILDLPEIKRVTTAAMEMNRLARIGRYLNEKRKKSGWRNRPFIYTFFLGFLCIIDQNECKKQTFFPNLFDLLWKGKSIECSIPSSYYCVVSV